MSLYFAPVEPGQRVIILDILRGFAIFGILMVNMLWMSAPIAISFSDEIFWISAGDNISEFLVHFLFEGKFYVLFSMLFGYGFALFLQKETDGVHSIVSIYIKRLIILIIFGAMHILLLWAGDILLCYGILGLLLILFRNSSNRKLIKWAMALLLIPVIIMGTFSLMFFLARMHPETSEAIDASLNERTLYISHLIQRALETYANGTLSEIISIRLEEYSLILPGIFFYYPNVLAMFLIGYFAARKGFLSNVSGHLPFFRKLLIWGLAVGLPANFIYAQMAMKFTMSNMGPETFLMNFLFAFGGIFLSLAYVSAIILIHAKGFITQFAGYLSAVGRMALTNYLLHSIITAFIFHSYGLGLYGMITIWQGIILTIVIFTLQIQFSVYWLKRFRFGPMEWLWRSMTYGQWQSLRI